MKRFIFSIVLLFVIVTTKAQTVDWGTHYGSASSGSPFISTNSTSFGFNSDFLTVELWLSPDGQTMNYIYTAKNLPRNENNMMAEVLFSISDDATQAFKVNKRIFWNVADWYSDDYEYQSYPGGTEYSISGSFELGLNNPESFLLMGSIIYWNDEGYVGDSWVQAAPSIIP